MLTRKKFIEDISDQSRTLRALCRAAAYPSPGGPAEEWETSIRSLAPAAALHGLFHTKVVPFSLEAARVWLNLVQM